MSALRKYIGRKLFNFLYSGRFGDVSLRDQLIRYLPEKPISYIDVGAFDGQFFDFINKEVSVSKALLIEPQEKYFSLLKKKYSDVEKVQLINSAVLSEAKELTFFENNMPATSSFLKADEKLLGNEIDISGTAVKMQVKTLDQLASRFNETIDLLKIDVQGAELEVMKGATEILSHTKFIWIEVSFKPIYVNSPLFEDILKYLESENFILVNILPGFKSKSGELLQADCLFKKK